MMVVFHNEGDVVVKLGGSSSWIGPEDARKLCDDLKEAAEEAEKYRKEHPLEGGD